MSSGLIVVKVGGSLFDLPELGTRLRRWLETLAAPAVVLVPGGGPAADVVRALDRCHHLGEEKSHWLALQAMSLNAGFLAALLTGSQAIGDVEDLGSPPERWLVLDAYTFVRADERRPGRLPHRWEVTSDSIAARAAVVAGARQLVLLKSIGVPEGIDGAEAAARGLVDPFFAETVRDVPVRVVNLRTWRP